MSPPLPGIIYKPDFVASTKARERRWTSRPFLWKRLPVSGSTESLLVIWRRQMQQIDLQVLGDERYEIVYLHVPNSAAFKISSVCLDGGKIFIESPHYLQTSHVSSSRGTASPIEDVTKGVLLPFGCAIGLVENDC